MRTLTAEFKLHNVLLLRGECRQDWSDHAFFKKTMAFGPAIQQAVMLGLIYFLVKEH